jgi:hypothetical protein
MCTRRIPYALAFLTLCSVPARGGSITYAFIEEGTTKVGATLTFAAPPASGNAGWSTTNSNDILRFELVDPVFGTPGPYEFHLLGHQSIGSTSGAMLDFGNAQGGAHSNYYILSEIDLHGSGPAGSYLAVSYSDNHGNGSLYRDYGEWVLLQGSAVPEPSSLVLGCIAGITGIACAWRRRIAKARRAGAAAKSWPM